MSDLKIFTENIEPKALEQIYTLLDQPAFKDCKVRIMPDVHAGKGCVIGFTADLGDKVIPNIVGVDIGCGMLTLNLGKIDIDFEKLDKVIREKVPCGREVHEIPKWIFKPMYSMRCLYFLMDQERLLRSMGTLGGGNHFIEIDAAEDGEKFLVIHSGSRNLGKQVAGYYQSKAITKVRGLYKMAERVLITQLKEAGEERVIETAIKELRNSPEYELSKTPMELCYLTGQDRHDYLHDMVICQQFAKDNRISIASAILEGMGWGFKSAFETVHNYIDTESNIVRKGAVSAKAGEILLIPMNMRDGCIIARGKGNADWNYSAPHGAGRLMSRIRAKETLTLSEYEKSMEGIYTTSVDSSTIDESPMAYKPMDEIIKNIGDTVEILEIIKPVYNFKAGE